jgi:hypothetical protein
LFMSPNGAVNISPSGILLRARHCSHFNISIIVFRTSIGTQCLLSTINDNHISSKNSSQMNMRFTRHTALPENSNSTHLNKLNHSHQSQPMTL